MRVHTIINGKAGTVVDSGREETCSEVRRHFEKAGVDAEVEIAVGEAIGEAIERAKGLDVDAIVIGGGDGTIASAAAQLLESDKALGIIPLGTFNLYARDLQISLNLAEAVEQLGRASIREVDAAEVNGEIFLCNSIIGMMPEIVNERESHRSDSRLVGVLSMGKALVRLLNQLPRLELTIEANGDPPRQLAVRSLVIANNSYHDGYAVVPTKTTLDKGHLAVYMSEHQTRAKMAKLFVEMAVGKWQRDPDLEQLELTEIEVRSRRGVMQVVNDGELLSLQSPLRYRIRPKALKVLLPAEYDPDA